MHPEGSATGQHNQTVPWLCSVLEQKLSRYSKSTWHCTLLTQPSQCYQQFVIMLQSALCFILPTVHFPTPYSAAYLHEKDERAQPRKFQSSKFLVCPPLPAFSISVAIFKASGITSAHCHSAARRKMTPDAANCYAERHHSHGTCCVYSAETMT
jgi:hypothetical protein